MYGLLYGNTFHIHGCIIISEVIEAHKEHVNSMKRIAGDRFEGLHNSPVDLDLHALRGDGGSEHPLTKAYLDGHDNASDRLRNLAGD